MGVILTRASDPTQSPPARTRCSSMPKRSPEHSIRTFDDMAFQTHHDQRPTPDEADARQDDTDQADATTPDPGQARANLTSSRSDLRSLRPSEAHPATFVREDRAHDPREGTMSTNATSPEAVGMSSARLERIAPVMESYVTERGVVGISTMISRRGEIVHDRAVRLPGQGGRNADGPGHDLPHLLDDQAGRVDGADAAARGRSIPARTPGRPVPPGVRRHQGDGRRRHPRRSGAPDADPRPAEPHQRPHLRLHGRQPRRPAVPRRPDHERCRPGRSTR